ncbi:GatB/YqeY domain-containing protein [Chloroflexota bacterium]
MDDPRVRIQADLKDAMRAKDRQRVTVLRSALNAIKQEEIDKRVEVSPQDAVALLMREAKKYHEAIADAEKAGRDDLVATAQEELAILEIYLPQQLSAEVITELAQAAINETGAASPKDMGNVMRVLMPKLKGQADGKLVNQIVRELLQ